MTEIIRTVGELVVLDRETWLLGREGDVMSAADWYDYTLFPIDEDDRLAVIATGEQVRQALRQLEEGKK